MSADDAPPTDRPLADRPLTDRPPVAHRELTGWGRTAPTASAVATPAWLREVTGAVHTGSDRGVIARGLGRGYGDAAQNAGGLVIDTTGAARFELDAETGTVRADAGVSLDALMRVLMPRGFFVPVTPGTRHVTVGGAIAADIHGKNHHSAGSWCSHVSSLRLALPSGEVLDITPESHPDLFWATAGGMGLTGVVLDATFRCTAIETSRLSVDTERLDDLDAVMVRMEETDDQFPYSAAWIDLVARGRQMGRSVLSLGRFARVDELPAPLQADPLAFAPIEIAPAPPWVPSGVLNKVSIRAFNELWFRKAPVRKQGEIQGTTMFFHPLDLVGGWNRIYGRRGFIQWQFVIPFGAEETLRSIVNQLSANGCTSFLAVLKRFGPGNSGMLSFPEAGWTLALDIPVGGSGLGSLLDRLDGQVVAAGGRVYLAKDSRMKPELLPAMYPRLAEWRAVRAEVDPDRSLRSDLGRRLGLC